MGDFIENGTLAGPMADAKPLPAGANADLIPNLTAARWNAHRSALLDLRDHVSGWVNVKSYGAACDGVTDDYADLSAMVTALGSAAATLIVPGPCLVGTDLTIPSNLAVRFEGAGMFTGSGRVTYAAWREPGLSWESTPRPWIIAHRGASWMHPENTIPAFDDAAGFGLPIEADVQMTADGFLVCIHDETVDRTTEGTGTVISKTLSDLLALNAADYVPGYPVTRIPTFGEYLGRYARRHLLIPESKDSLPAGKEMARQIAAAGLEDSVVVQSFEASETTAIKAANPRLRMLQLGLDGTPPLLATLQSVGAWAAGPSALDVTEAYVDEVQAAGIYVIPYTVNRVEQAETLLGYGVDGLFSDDPAYLRMLIDTATPSGTTIPVPARLPASGWSSNSLSTMTLASGYVTRASGGTTEQIVFPPVRLPVAATHQIDTTLKLTFKAADVTRYMGIRFALKQDRFTHLFLLNATAAGYTFVLRGDGLAKIEKWTNGSAATLASASWTAPAEGDAIPIRIVMTATTITVTRTDLSQTVSVTNSDLTRDGFVDMFAHTSRVGVGPITVTY
jgi:glycerophosphoryl diester phosphodiesterase